MTSVPATPSVPHRLTITRHVLTGMVEFAIPVRYCGADCTVIAELERHDTNVVVRIEPDVAVEIVPVVVKRAAGVVYMAAWRAFKIGDMRMHTVLLSASRGLSAFAREYAQAMAQDQNEDAA